MANAGASFAIAPPRLDRSSAKAKHPVLPRVFKVGLRNGYVMYVFPEPKAQFVEVLIYRHDKGRFGVSRGVYYVVGSESGVGDPNAWPDLSAKVEPGAVSVHLGPLGSIDMRFVPTGGSRQYRPYCGGQAVRFARGHYEGSIRFAGGHGYPAVEASLAQAVPGRELRQRCMDGIAEGPPTLPGAQLLAGSVRPNTPSFSAFKNAPNGLSHIGAGVGEFRRGVSMVRFASVVAPPSAFRYNQALTKATVRPPAPFSGVGIYDESQDRRHRWSGSLAVDVPGREGVNLTHFPLLGFMTPARWIPPHPNKQG